MITSQRINLGDTVRQKCGGPGMTVVSIDLAYPCKDGSIGGLFCIWEKDSLLFEDVFSPYALDLIRHGAPLHREDERRQFQRDC